MGTAIVSLRFGILVVEDEPSELSCNSLHSVI